MGVLAESEGSGNTTSKGQEKSRKTSIESSQSPKAAQPSCLRGAFVRIFLKRAEPDNRSEEDASSNRNTEDQEEVRGKKRRLTGSLFRLPCLRPAETTGNDVQDKTDEQGNDAVQEEDLKPYSKASFLRKIRCYRLMRERDATEKEKVIEMTQRKHDRENAEIKQQKERVSEQADKGPQVITHEEVVGEKVEDKTEQGCPAKNLGQQGKDSQEPEIHGEHVGDQEDHLGKQESSMEKVSRSGEESIKMEDPAQSLGALGKDLAEQESCVDTLKEKNVLLEAEGSCVDEKELEQLKNEKVEEKEQVLVGEQEEDIPKEQNHAATARDLDNALPNNKNQLEEVRGQEKQEEAMEKELPKKDTEGSAGAMQKCYTENKCHTDVLGESGNCVSDQEGCKEKVGNTENNMSGQQHLMDEIEQNNQKEKGLEEKDKTERDSRGDTVNKMVGNATEKKSGEENHAELGDGQENHLVDRDSHTKNVDNSRKEKSQHASQCLVKDGHAETLGELKDKTAEVSGISLGFQDEQNVTENVSTQEVTMPIPNQESVTCELQDLSKRTSNPEDNEDLLVSVIKMSTANNIITCASSDDVHTQVLEIKKEVLTSANAMDLTLQEAHILHKCLSHEDDGIGCESTDLGSLRMEVQDMVEWLVQEASDRLSNYTQESEGTG